MIFFFKQKTAYEMRISDWSSDVCSSDLRQNDPPRTCPPGARDRHRKAVRLLPRSVQFAGQIHQAWRRKSSHYSQLCRRERIGGGLSHSIKDNTRSVLRTESGSDHCWTRSEEHTSELQSLMRIADAVICWHKHSKTLLHIT